jgi:hypothetical protein
MIDRARMLRALLLLPVAALYVPVARGLAHVWATDPYAGHGPFVPAFAATVANSVFLGNCIHVESRLADGKIVIAEVALAAGGFNSGDRVHVWWNPADELHLPPEKEG